MLKLTCTAHTALFVCASPVVAQAAEPSIVGCWDIEVELPFPMSNKEFSVCFEKTKSGLTGKIRKSEDKPWRELKPVQQEGTSFSFSAQGEKGKVDFNGKLSGANKMKGKMKAPKGTPPFVGMRKT